MMFPDVVIRQILPLRVSVNQSAPSGPGVMFRGPLDAVGTEYSVKTACACASWIAVKATQ